MLLAGLLSTTICWLASFGGVDSQPSIVDLCDEAVVEDLSTCTMDLMPSMTNLGRITVENIRSYFGELPPECHQDYCKPAMTFSTEKGNISWPQTTVGYRRFVRCPYAYAGDLYAFRDCLISSNQTISWTTENTATCPMPEFSTAIDKLFNVTSGLITCTEYNCSTLLSSLSLVLEIPSIHPRDPILREDHQKLMRMCLDLVTRCGSYPGLSTGALWNASDLLLKREFVVYWDKDTGPRFLDYLYWIFPNDPKNASTTRFLGENIDAFAITYSDDTRNVYFSYPCDSDQISGALNITVPESEQLVGLHTFLIKPSRLPDEMTQNLHITIVDRTTTALPLTTQPAPSTTLSPQPEISTGFDVTTSETDSNNSLSSMSISSQWFQTATTSDALGTTTGFGDTAPSTELSTVTFTTGSEEMTLSTGSDEEILTTGSEVKALSTGSSKKILTTVPEDKTFSMIGSLMFVKPQFERSKKKEGLNGTGETLPIIPNYYMLLYQDVLPVAQKTVDDEVMITVDVTLRDPSFGHLVFGGDAILCARTTGYQQQPSPYSVPQPINPWTADCITQKIQEDVNAVLCRCDRPTFVAVFRHVKVLPVVPPSVRNEQPKPQSDLSVFLGFPYVREIYITGEVFKAVSLLCLVLTVLSYAVLRQARKGTPTRILLNLCVSLIVLLIVLYVAEYEASSRMGCRVLNVFRYYLVLVSLLWNAVEAHNMYKMLIKVFNAETSHFVLIAGIIAWGLPAIAVGIGFAVDVETFDGTYDHCIFKCALRPETRLFWWIIPMAVIILHNVIVFAMVMKVVVRTHNNPMPGQKSGKPNGGRLCGALTMLVLLGVPWMISAFGVIDAAENSAENLLQKAFSGILVIFVGLQGLFIFIFHCARNKAIRDQLRLHLITAAARLRSSFVTSSNGSGSDHRLDSFSSKTSSVNTSRVTLKASST